ncbi:MAG: 16S rRNA (cytosine(1402)-N(4))-methyltransferase RsmH [Myxococcota bacterium]
MAFRHEPVLLNECLEFLDPQPGSVVVDATVGGGGHAAEILTRIAPNGTLIGLDLDPEALEATAQALALPERRSRIPRVELKHSSFRQLGDALAELAVDRVDAVLFDLGVSSHQLDSPERGFRFGDGPAAPLDMRMDRSDEWTAADLLRESPADELEKWFREYGELRGARRLARLIVSRRKADPVRTNADLRRLVRDARVGGGRRHDPSTLVFQALRIALNDELSALREGLEAAISALRPGGRLVVIAYHSLEDRIVKTSFRESARGCRCPPRTPVCICGLQVRLRVITQRPVRPGDGEVARNPRARSARLRAAERVSAEATR